MDAGFSFYYFPSNQTPTVQILISLHSAFFQQPNGTFMHAKSSRSDTNKKNSKIQAKLHYCQSDPTALTNLYRIIPIRNKRTPHFNPKTKISTNTHNSADPQLKTHINKQTNHRFFLGKKKCREKKYIFRETKQTNSLRDLYLRNEVIGTQEEDVVPRKKKPKPREWL